MRLRSLVRRVLLAVLVVSTYEVGQAQSPSERTQSQHPDTAPEPAIPAIIKAFETYEVVAMSAAHGQKDIDDFVLSLIRDPDFPRTVNDIVVECGNLRYQSILDRYIAGEDVPFSDVQHVWRDTTVQQMCGSSGFYEQLLPLVRALNQHLPASGRLRVVAADPPIDWSVVHTYNDLIPFFDRDGSIASVMEREVLSKHRKALMLFGLAHVLHGGGPGEGDAVTRYERYYPGKTFVIGGDFGLYGNGDNPLGEVKAPGGVWPSLLKAKNTRLGKLGLDSYFESPITVDRDCNVIDAFAAGPGKTLADQIDAFLYLGPQNLQLAEPVPADIALDRVYRTEWLRRMKLVGLPAPATLDEVDAGTVAGAAHPVLDRPSKQPIPEAVKLKLRQSCLSTKKRAAEIAR